MMFPDCAETFASGFHDSRTNTFHRSPMNAENTVTYSDDLLLSTEERALPNRSVPHRVSGTKAARTLD